MLWDIAYGVLRMIFRETALKAISFTTEKRACLFNQICSHFPFKVIDGRKRIPQIVRFLINRRENHEIAMKLLIQIYGKRQAPVSVICGAKLMPQSAPNNRFTRNEIVADEACVLISTFHKRHRVSLQECR